MKKLVLILGVVFSLMSCEKEIINNPKPPFDLIENDSTDLIENNDPCYADSIIGNIWGDTIISGFYKGEIHSTSSSNALQIVDAIPIKQGSVQLNKGMWSNGSTGESGCMIRANYEYYFKGYNYQDPNNAIDFFISNPLNSFQENWNSRLIDNIITITMFNRVYIDQNGDSYLLEDKFEFNLATKKIIKITQHAFYNGNDNSKIYNGWYFTFEL